MTTYHESGMPARDRSPRAAKVRLIVVHVNVGSETANGAVSLARFTQQQQGAYHEIVDNDQVVVTAQDNEVVAGAAGANSDGWHICLVGMPDQSAEQWADDYSQHELDIAAERVALACKRFGIPARFIDADAVKRGDAGICGHKQISDAYHKSTHWDPGPAFPWTAFLERVQRVLAPSADHGEDIDMTPEQLELHVAAALLKLLDNSEFNAKLRDQVRVAVAELFDTPADRPVARKVQGWFRNVVGK